MAKKKKNKAAKADKALNMETPKTIAGVKVPKKLRKLGDQAVKAAKNPVVSEVVAGALLAAAAALRQGKDPKTRLGAATGDAAGNGPDGVRKEVGRLSDSLKLMALDLARHTLDAIEEQKRKPAATAPHLGDEPGVADTNAANGLQGSGRNGG
ncbi:MAG TPA: hypothetical protein VEZ70_08205 [Allosphingosinicella sp.]|nr:hypothetical protein [Allosphingosinicella sp.]